MKSRPGSALLAGAAIVLAGLAAYAHSLAGPFVFDDDGSIVHNPTIRRLWAWPGPLAPPSGGGLTVEGRPVLNLSFAINHALGGLRVEGYHAVNIAIHLLAGLTLFGIVGLTLGQIARSGPAILPAFLVALIWTVHPLQTESVTYVVQRAESLAGLFYLLTVYGFVRYSAPLQSAGPGIWAVLSVLSCLCGMATKEVMATAPVIVLLYDRTFAAGTFAEAWRRRRSYYLALASTWLVLAWLVFREGSRGGTVGAGSGVSAWQYALTQPGAILHYLRLVAWPHPLILDYGTEWAAGAWEVAFPAAAVAALAALSGFLLFRRDSPGAPAPGSARATGTRAFGFAGAWFFIILAPTSSFIPGNRQTLAEHRMYLPLAAVVAAAVCGAFYLAGRARSTEPGDQAGKSGRRAKTLVLALGCAAALVCADLTARRNATYASALSLYGDTVLQRPRNPYAHSNYGFALGEAGRVDEAVREFRLALGLKPDLADARYNLGLIFERAGQAPAAREEYAEALRLNPGNAEARYNLALLLAREGRPAEAAGHFTEVVRLRPGFADAHLGLGNALLQLGRSADALDQFESAVRTRPDYAEAQYNLGLLLAQSGRTAEGMPHIAEALRLKPDFEEGHYRLGTILAQSGLMDQALPEFSAAVRLNPRHAEAQLDLGNVLLAMGHVTSAIACYEAALRLRPDFAEALDNLAYARQLPPSP